MRFPWPCAPDVRLLDLPIQTDPRPTPTDLEIVVMAYYGRPAAALLPQKRGITRIRPRDRDGLVILRTGHRRPFDATPFREPHLVPARGLCAG